MGVLALGFLLVDSRGTLWLVYVLAAGISAVSALFEPAASAAIPNLVDAEDLAAANAVTGSAWGTMLVVGAGIGGLVVTAFGNDVAYLVDAGSFFVGAVLLLWVRRPTSQPREQQEHPALAQATTEAVRFARRDHRVLALFASRVGVGTALGVVALLPIVAIDTFHAGDRGTGILFAFRGAGALMGPFLIRPLVRRGALSRALAAIVLLPAVLASMYALLPWAPGIWVAASIALCAHLAGGATWTLTTYSYQSLVPDRVLGRIFGFDGALITFMLSASNAVCGVLAVQFGVRAVMSGIGVVVVAYTLVLWVATRNLRRSLAQAPPAGGLPRAAR
jgi:predicted MFS family arabinose efflux permease